MAQDRIKRYSETLPADLQQQVRSIVARHGDRFQTRELAIASEDGGTMRRWSEARKKAATGLWTVRQYQDRSEYLKRDADGALANGQALEQATLLSGACYFDALRACAELEAADLQTSSETAADVAQAREKLGTLHYRAFGEAEGTVFDARDNMPVPVADGEILTDDCMLAGDALAIAERSKNNVENTAGMALTVTTPEMFRMAALVPAAGASTGALVEGFSQSSRLRHVIAKREATMGKLDRAFGDALKTDFKKFGFRLNDGQAGGSLFVVKAAGVSAAGAASLLFTMPTLGGAIIITSGIVGGLAGLNMLFEYDGQKFGRLFSENGFVLNEPNVAKKIRQSRAVVETLPEAPMRDVGRDILNQVELGFRALSARCAFQRAAENNGVTRFYSRFAMNREINKFIKTAKKHGMDEDVINQILHTMQANPESPQFNDKIRCGVAEQIAALKTLMDNAQGRAVTRVPHVSPPQMLGVVG